MKPYSAYYTHDAKSNKRSQILDQAKKSSSNIALYLPKTSDVEQITALGSTEIHYLYTSGRCKALCAYFGELLS